MKRMAMLYVAAVMTAALPARALCEEPASKPGLFKRAASVDKPIPETYEPLNSTYVGDGEKLNQDIEQSWDLKKQAREREQAAAGSSADRQALEQRIQEPNLGLAPQPEPQVRDTGESLEIKGE